jgi:hypothetical protein
MASHFLYYSFKNAGYDLVELQKIMVFQSLGKFAAPKGAIYSVEKLGWNWRICFSRDLKFRIKVEYCIHAKTHSYCTI